MAEDLTQIIDGIKNSYNRTNMQDVDLEALMHERPEIKVGYLLQNLEPESSKDYAINFDPVESLFLNKLISQEVLDRRIIIDAGDFWRGLVFLDYMTTIVLNDYRLLDEMYDVAKELEQRDQDLDPDLKIIVQYAAMHYVSHAGMDMVRGRQGRASRERYRRKNKSYEPEYVILRKISPVYEALGAKVLDLPQEQRIKDRLPEMLYLYDIKAAIFTDCIFEHLQDDGIKQQVMEKFQSGDYYKASLLAITGLGKEVSSSTISDYIDRLASNGRR